jgi:di/tripeptidase
MKLKEFGRYQMFYPSMSMYNFGTHKANKNNTLPLNKDLLKDLLSLSAGSGHEDKVRDYILSFIKSLPEITYTVDRKGNLYIIKGKADVYPCVVAHMDEVCPAVAQRIVVELNNVFIGLDPNSGDHAGCPGDDRVGIYCALELLRLLPACKVCFFVEEEIGAKNGSGQAPLQFFIDCSFILQADRMGNNELIVESNGGTICSEEFMEAIDRLSEQYEYDFSEDGIFTDCGVLSRREVGISCINLGAGYYDSHSNEEKVCLTDVENVLNLMYKICLDYAGRRWLNEFQPYYSKYAYKTYKSVSSAAKPASKIDDRLKHRWDDGYDDIWEADGKDFAVPAVTLPCDECLDFNCKGCKFSVV